MDTTRNTPNDSEVSDSRREFEALQSVIATLQPLGAGAQSRIMDATATFLGVRTVVATPAARPGSHLAGSTESESVRTSFSADLAMTPKEFMMEKQPRTDVERVACLAYYLTHYRDQPAFKTLDLSKLNTEAAQPKFSNAANASNNAVKMGYLAPATKGQRQLGAAGERFVQALPDRVAAKDAMSSMRPKRRKKRVRAKPSAEAQ